MKANGDLMLYPIKVNPHFQEKFNQYLNRISELQSALGFEEIMLIGSLARGEATPHSDIDFLVIFNDTPSKQIRGELYDLIDDINRPFIDICITTREFLDNNTNGFAKFANRDGITIFKRSN